MATKGPRILIVDDELQIRRFLRIGLTSHDYNVKDVGTGKEALAEVSTFAPNLIILDLGLPDLDGFKVLTIIREYSNVPIIILSVNEQEQTKIFALDSGADDYITKPFSMGELLARIRTVLRHTTAIDEGTILMFDDLSVDLIHRRVKVNEAEVKLTPKEYDLIKLLALNAGKVLPHKFLLHSVWGESFVKNTHYLRIYMRQLRQKIELEPSAPKHIITEPGVGYRLI